MSYLSIQEDGITKNIKSVQFGSTVTGAHSDLLYLRTRSHAVTVNIVAHATYFTAILKEVRRASLKRGSERRNLRVGVIGGSGRLAQQLIASLVRYARIDAASILVSMRRRADGAEQVDGTEQVGGKQVDEKHVETCTDSVNVISCVDVCFICCPPSQLDELISEIAGPLKQSDHACVLYSIVAGVTRTKLCDRLDYSQVVVPEYTYASATDTDQVSWRFGENAAFSLAKRTILEQTLPLPADNALLPVRLNATFLNALLLCCVNTCSSLALSANNASEIIYAALFRAAGGQEVSVRDDFTDHVNLLMDELDKLDLRQVEYYCEDFFDLLKVDGLREQLNTKYTSLFIG